jgi:hypothetical protein
MTTNYKTVSWSPTDFKYFKRAYTRAVNGGAEQFKFQGNDFVTGYAKYLIQYLESNYDQS